MGSAKTGNEAVTKRKYFSTSLPLRFLIVSNSYPIRIHIVSCLKTAYRRLFVPGKPYQSCLLPYEKEIVVLRRKKTAAEFFSNFRLVA